MQKNPIIKKQGFAAIAPFNDYVKLKDDWRAKHPKAKIIEEIKSLNAGVVEVPHPTLIGKIVQQNTIMIAWAVVFEEIVTEEEKLIAQ